MMHSLVRVLLVALCVVTANATIASRYTDKVAALQAQFKNEVLWHRKIKSYELEVHFQIKPRAKLYLKKDSSALTEVEQSYWTSAVGLREGLDFHCYQSFHAPGIVISNTAEMAWWYQLDAGADTHAPKTFFEKGKNLPTDETDWCEWKSNPHGPNSGYKSLVTGLSGEGAPTGCQWVQVSKTKTEVVQTLSDWKRTGKIPGAAPTGTGTRYSEVMLHYRPDEVLAVSVEFVPIDTTSQSGVSRNILLYAMQLRASLKLAGVDVPYVHVDSSSGVPVMKFFNNDEQMLAEADKVTEAKKAVALARKEFPRWLHFQTLPAIRNFDKSTLKKPTVTNDRSAPNLRLVKDGQDPPKPSPSQLYKPVHGGYPDAPPLHPKHF